MNDELKKILAESGIDVEQLDEDTLEKISQAKRTKEEETPATTDISDVNDLTLQEVYDIFESHGTLWFETQDEFPNAPNPISLENWRTLLSPAAQEELREEAIKWLRKKAVI